MLFRVPTFFSAKLLTAAELHKILTSQLYILARAPYQQHHYLDRLPWTALYFETGVSQDLVKRSSCGIARMPDPNLQAYLAEHYLSGPKADAILARSSDGKVKRKKKKPKIDTAEASSSSSSGLVFKDDSDSWKVAGEQDGDDDGFTPQIVGNGGSAGPSKAFRKIGSSKADTKDGANTEVGVANNETASPAEEPREFKAGLRSKEEMKAARLAREERKRREAEQAAQHSRSAEASSSILPRQERWTTRTKKQDWPNKPSTETPPVA